MFVSKEKSNSNLYRYSTFCILGTVSIIECRMWICKVFALKGFLNSNNLVKNSILIPLYIDGTQEPPLSFAWSIIIQVLHGIKYYIRTKIIEHHGNKVDVKFLRDFIISIGGSRIHNR